jgi:hypothetical protein
LATRHHRTKIVKMSHAFVKEDDDQWLDEIPPTLNALLVYLSRENNGNPVYEKRTSFNPTMGKEIHEMSNGLSYTINDESKWFVVE